MGLFYKGAKGITALSPGKHTSIYISKNKNITFLLADKYLGMVNMSMLVSKHFSLSNTVQRLRPSSFSHNVQSL